MTDWQMSREDMEMMRRANDPSDPAGKPHLVAGRAARDRVGLNGNLSTTPKRPCLVCGRPWPVECVCPHDHA